MACLVEKPMCRLPQPEDDILAVTRLGESGAED
jgi:hypothetical protein